MKSLRQAGYTAAELLLVTSIVTSISMGTYAAARKKAVETVCRMNLHQIQNALTLFLIENNDRLPEAIFYPDNLKSNKAIHNILAPYIKGPVFVCPALPEDLQNRGLTYLWNDTYSGQRRDTIPEGNKKWLMIEMTAVYKDIPPPHSRGYAILYLDGHIDYSPGSPLFTAEDSGFNLNKYRYAYCVIWPYLFSYASGHRNY